MRSEYDPKLIEKIGAGGYHCFSKTKQILEVNSREFVMDVLIFEDLDGTIYHVTSSNPDLYDQHPLSEGATRAESPMGGWILTPDKDNKKTTWCTMLMEVNFSELIPDYEITTVFKHSGYEIASLRETMPKFMEKFHHNK